MSDEKHPYTPVEAAPIPTYEEATSSRPQSHLGPREISDDAERQGLLQPGGNENLASSSRRRNGYYQPPSVQSVRDSEDTDLDLAELHESDDEDPATEEAELRRELHEMDIDDTEAAGDRRRRARSTFSKRISSLTTTLSRFQFPRFSFRWLTSRVRFPSISDRYKPSWPIVARLFGLFMVISLIYALFVSEMFPGMQGGALGGAAFNPEWVRKFAQDSISAERIEDSLKYITSYDHIAGTRGSYALGQWIEKKFRQGAMEQVEISEYEVYLNYPTSNGRKVAIVEPEDLKWTAKLEEEAVYASAGLDQSKQQTLSFHGFSKGGSAQGHLVYANYGSREDYKSLADSHIQVVGSVVLVRSGGSPANLGSKVKAAQEAGAVGCLIYTDPADDGFFKGTVWPDGVWRTEDSVERGSVALTSYIIGDVLTPGEPSKADTVRISKDDNPGLVKIPSLPLAWRDAQRLLQALKGHGESDLPDEWKGAVPDVEWWTGDEGSPVVRIENEQSEEEKQPIYNIIGWYQGYETPEEKIVIGNHRDSWCFGAADPGSGTAVMLEVIAVLGELHKQGWRPARSLVFASWDGSTHNLIGSTEFVEEHLADLRNSGIAYLNVGAGVTGPDLHFSGSPLLERVFTRVLGRVSSPERVTDPDRNATYAEILAQSGTNIAGIGAGSDALAFQCLAGMTSLDFGFRGPAPPSHSCAETFEWMSSIVDPTFRTHAALAEIWILLILELTTSPVLPFNFKDFSTSVAEYVDALAADAKKMGADAAGNDGKVAFDVTGLHDVVAQFQRDAVQFQSFEDHWYTQVVATGGFESRAMAAHRWSHNGKMRDFEAHLLDWPWDGVPLDGVEYGIPSRTQFKHVLFGPSTRDADQPAFFPAVRDAMERGDWAAAQSQVDKAAGILKRASEKLLH